MFRRLVLILVLATLAAPASAQKPGGSPGGGQDGSFTVVNRSGQVIREIYASPVTQSDWGQDRLGQDTLADGRSFAVRLRPGGGCRNDLRVVFADGRDVERRDLDTCAEREVTIRAPGTPQRPPVADDGRRGNPSFNLVNAGRRTIRELYASPSIENDWGPDRLGRDVVEAGGRYAIRLLEGPCRYDVRVVWEGGAPEERRAVNLCEVVDLTFR